jgi:hypothetical protein
VKPEFREMRRAIYALKRKFPQSVVLCRTTGTSTDVSTGRQTETLVKSTIKRAVFLPARALRDFAYDLSFIAANKNFTYGGLYDHTKRVVLIDRRDVDSSFVVDLNMHVIFDGRRYEVKELREYEEQEVILLVIDSLSGAPLMDHHDESVSTNMDIQGSNTVSA